MNPGRELDALIAEKVMGWKTGFREDGYGPILLNHETEGCPTCGYTAYIAWFDVPSFSTDIAAAMMIVDKLPYEFHLIKVGDKFPDLFSKPGTKFKACITVDYGKHYEAWSTESMAHAICLAALKVVEASKNQPPQNP